MQLCSECYEPVDRRVGCSACIGNSHGLVWVGGMVDLAATNFDCGRVLCLLTF